MSAEQHGGSVRENFLAVATHTVTDVADRDCFAIGRLVTALLSLALCAGCVSGSRDAVTELMRSAQPLPESAAPISEPMPTSIKAGVLAGGAKVARLGRLRQEPDYPKSISTRLLHSRAFENAADAVPPREPARLQTVQQAVSLLREGHATPATTEPRRPNLDIVQQAGFVRESTADLRGDMKKSLGGRQPEPAPGAVVITDDLVPIPPAESPTFSTPACTVEIAHHVDGRDLSTAPGQVLPASVLVPPAAPSNIVLASQEASQLVQNPGTTLPPPPVVGLQGDGGPPVSLHLEDVEVRKVLEMFSKQTSRNILVAPGVSGAITVNLTDANPDDALQAVLKLAGLVSVQEGNAMFVYSREEYAAMHDKPVRSKVTTRLFHLNHVRGSDVETLITPFLTTDIGKVSVTPASETGIGSNSELAGGDSLAGGELVIVQDYETVVNRIGDVIAQLDVAPMQVVIEAVIMEVILDDEMTLGVNIGALDTAARNLVVSGGGAAINAAAGFNPAQLVNAAGQVADGFTENNNGVKFGFIGDNVTGFIEAIEDMAETRVLASPRVMVLNKQRAELIIGERIGFKTLTVTQTSTVEDVQFLNVGTLLRLRPFVSSDGLIRMEVHPERSTGDVVDGVPRTRTNEMTTNVVVPNGATVAMAGLIEEEDVVSYRGVPGLSKLPYLGAAFRTKKSETRRKELIILLTPRIWTPDCEAERTIDDPPAGILSGLNASELRGRTLPPSQR